MLSQNEQPVSFRLLIWSETWFRHQVLKTRIDEDQLISSCLPPNFYFVVKNCQAGLNWMIACVLLAIFQVSYYQVQLLNSLLTRIQMFTGY